MSKKILNAAFLCIAATLSQQVAAEGSYFGIGASNYSIEVDVDSSLSISGDSKVLEGYYGFELNNYFAWELRAGFGLSGSNLEGQVGNQSANIGDFKIDSMYGIYAKPQFKANGFKGYALLGYAGYSANSEIKVPGYNESISSNDSGFSYGVGAGWDFGQHGVSLEWKSTKIDGGDISGLAVFYQYNF
jgi:Outer membrane protein beta-barrel domain